MTKHGVEKQMIDYLIDLPAERTYESLVISVRDVNGQSTTFFACDDEAKKNTMIGAALENVLESAKQFGILHKEIKLERPS